MVLVQKNEDNSIFKLLAALTFEIADKYRDLWVDFPSYLSIYKTNPKTIVFCILLLKSCYQNKEILAKFSTKINELNKELTLIGLQNPDQEIKIISTYINIQIVRTNKETSIITQYKEHYDLIIKIAESSINIDSKYFQLFWSHIIRLPPKDLPKFAEIALNIFETKELTNDCKKLLIEIIVQDNHLINHQNLETIINCYFENLKSVKNEDCFNFLGKFFSNLSKIYFNESCELFKSNILIFLRSDLDDIQSSGLVILDSFIDTFIMYISRDISTFINLLLKISENSSQKFGKATEIIKNYLSCNDLNNEDTEKVLNFIIECFIGQADHSKIIDGYFLCQSIGPTPIYFDKFIEIHENVAETSLPEYFGILVNLHSRENDLTNDKYQQFFQFVTDFFYKSSEKVDEIEDVDESDEYYNRCLVARSSCSNLIFNVHYRYQNFF